MAFVLIQVGAGLSIYQALHLSVNLDNRMLQPREAFTFLGHLLEQTFLNTQELASTSPTAAHLRRRSVLNVFPPPLPAPAPSGDEGPAWSLGGPEDQASLQQWLTESRGQKPTPPGLPWRDPRQLQHQVEVRNLLWKHASSNAPLPPNTNYI